jgi:asparagine synthase (glutamine-hydrolysing)
MSGIVGIVQFDGSVIDRRLLRHLTDALTFRGRDAQAVWVKGNVGFGHTLFKTTEESEHDCQPLSLDGNMWVVADARIDARDDLFPALKAAGEDDFDESHWTDAELILRAYRCWGADCVNRLLGDFAFGIWDDERQTLFCARDHMGVKPFYYARLGSLLIFSNTLDCIRRHPAVSAELNDLAVADFLLFGCNQDPTTTSFAGIQRLAPAHHAMWSADDFRLRRYWSMPIDEPVFYKRAVDYTDRFHEILGKSISDRLRTRHLCVFMSGGLDSPTLAATARDVMGKQYASYDLRALTVIDRFASDESRYARMAATYLQIPAEYRELDDAASANWEEVSFTTPEPHPAAWTLASEHCFWRELESYSRVFFFGEGPDNALHFDWRPCLSYLIRHRLYGRLLTSLTTTVLSQKYPPFGLRLFNRFGRSCVEAAYPPWLAVRFEARLNLRERWSTFNCAPVSTHPFRQVAYASLQSPLWQLLFDAFDPAVTRASFEVRHPFLDLRMLRFMLAVPALPWCRSKYLIRRAMSGKLPREVLRRRKSGVPTTPFRKNIADLCTLPFMAAQAIREYVDPERIPGAIAKSLIESNLRVRILNHWLQNSLPANDNYVGGTSQWSSCRTKRPKLTNQPPRSLTAHHTWRLTGICAKLRIQSLGTALKTTPSSGFSELRARRALLRWVVHKLFAAAFALVSRIALLYFFGAFQIPEKALLDRRHGLHFSRFLRAHGPIAEQRHSDQSPFPFFEHAAPGDEGFAARLHRSGFRSLRAYVPGQALH